MLEQKNLHEEIKDVICNACHLKFTDIPSYKLHRSTEFHVYNTKRQIAELEPITEEVFEMKKVAQAASTMSLSNTTTTQWKCVPCSKSFKTLESLNTHKNSKKHKKQEKEHMKNHPDDPVSSLFKCSSYANSTDSIVELQRELMGHDKPLSIEEDNKKSHYVKTTLESLRICLFCNQENKGVKKNLDHMRTEHNFIILDIECLINLKGLLAYIAERIQLGRLCLNCEKQFKSATGC